MRKIKILDCTLRDGGFINNWEFGLGSIRDIIYRLDKSNIDIIEIGFLNDTVKYSPDISVFPHTKYINNIFENLNVSQAQIVAMIDYGTFNIENIENRSDTFLDGIRVIFKKEKIEEALEYCKEIMLKGYKVFVQPVSITSYKDNEILNLIEKVNLLNPYAVSIVDTYGLMFKEMLIKYFYLMDNNLNKNITIGYHSHNNFQLANSNSMELLDKRSKRNIMIDTSLFGMGKGAGNANTELMAFYINNEFDTKYNLDQILETIDINIIKLYGNSKWGYSLLSYIAAFNDCHPQYVDQLIKKKTLSIHAINLLLSKIKPNRKLAFDKNLIEDLYQQYQCNIIDDTITYSNLKEILDNRNILILSPGFNLVKQHQDIDKYISEHNPLIISVNFLPSSFSVDLAFVSNAKRYSQFLSANYDTNKSIKIIATSNITESALKLDYKVNYSSLLNEQEIISDNSTLMLLNLLVIIGIKKVSIAGFDGFNEIDKGNYFEQYLNFDTHKDDYFIINKKIKGAVLLLQNDLDIEFITHSIYN